MILSRSFDLKAGTMRSKHTFSWKEWKEKNWWNLWFVKDGEGHRRDWSRRRERKKYRTLLNYIWFGRSHKDAATKNKFRPQPLTICVFVSRQMTNEDRMICDKNVLKSKNVYVKYMGCKIAKGQWMCWSLFISD